MAKHDKEQQDWLDAAFNDKETQSEIDRARRSRNIGCLIGAFVIIAAVIVLVVMSCGSIAAVMQA